MGGVHGWVGCGKSLNKEEMTQIVEFRVAMTCTCMHPQRANIPLQGLDRRALTVGAISGPQSQLGALLGTISPAMDLHGWQKAFRESRPVDISQWRQ